MNDDLPGSLPEALQAAVGSRYRFERMLAEGGMGTVYVAQDVKHERLVAIKTIHPNFTSQSARERFGREIKVTARLQHPHILPLLDSGMVGDLLYYVMPFVEGESLRERLDRAGQLPIPDALRIAGEIADALACAHAADVVHRDIKPANILLSGGHVLVMDFGIARAVSDAGGGTLTGTGMSIGTPLYMSPEQAADATAADGRSDIYSLGCVLYEMLAGQPPFTGPNVESIIRQHVMVAPAPVTNYRPSVPADAGRILDRALAKSPADRFQQAEELSGALAAAGRAGGGTPVAPRRLSPLVAVAIYLAGSWAALQIVENAAETVGLPAWVVPFALVLLLIGLPVVLITAVVQSRGRAARSRGREGRTGPITPRPGRGRDPAARPRGSASAARFFSWRNAVAGGVMALALWGLVAVGWLLWFRDAPPDSPAVATRSAGEVGGGTPAVESAADAAVAADSDLVAAPGQEPPPAQESAPGPSSPAGADRSADPPPPTRRAGPDPAAAAATRDRERAEGARRSAELAGALALGSSTLARADSLMNVATRAEAGGRFQEASRAFEGAREAYAGAAEEARTTWTTRIDSAMRSVDSLRQRADRTAAPFADAERLRDDATRLEAGERYAEAFSTLQRAGRTYARALPAVELPPPSGDPAGVEEADPPPPPEERIRAAMDRLERAYEAEDLAALQAVWVNLSAVDLRNLRDSFEAVRDIDYQYRLDPGSIQLSGDTIDFVVQVRLEFRVASTGTEGSSDESDAFRLVASATGDVLRSR